MTALAERPALPASASERRASVMHRVRELQAAAWLGPILAVALAVWVTRSVWGGRPIAGEDVMFHLVRADVGIDELFAHGRLVGWSPRFYLGHELFLVYGPGSTAVVAIARLLSNGALSNAGALKVVALTTFVALPLGVAFLARSYGLSRRAAGLAALLSLLVSNVFGLGVEGLLVVGLFAHQVGALWFCIALGALLRIPVDRRLGWVVVGAGALGALLVTHLISVAVLVIVFAVSLASLQLTVRLTRPALGRLAVAAGGAAGLASFWLVPFVAHRDLIGFAATWGTPPLGERLREVLDGELLFAPGVAAVVLAAWAYGALRVVRRRRYALAVMAAPLVFFVAAHFVARQWDANISAVQLANRGLGYVGLLAILPLAALGGLLARELRASAGGIAAEIAFVGLVALLVAASLTSLDGISGEFAEPVPQMRDAAAELARVVPEGARFATERDYPSEIDRTGVIHPETWLARESGRNSLNGVGLESTIATLAPFEPARLGTRPPEQSADALAELGVTHVVTTSDELALFLGSSARFELRWQQPPVSILAVRPQADRPEPASLLATDAPASARLVRAEPEHLRIDVRASEPTEAVVALGWSPKWHGQLDGEPVPLRRTSDGRVAVSLPARRSVLELRFERDVWDRAGLAISVFTAAALLAWYIAQRRRNEPARQSASSSFSRIA